MIDPSGNMSMMSLTATMAMRTSLIGLRAYGIYDTASAIYNGSLDDLSVQDMILSVIGDRIGGKIFNKLMQSKMMLSLGRKYQDTIDKLRCKFNSFDGTTLVSTENGLVPIQEIKIGDMVWAYNEANQSKSLQEVTHLIRGEGDKALVDITLSDGEIITATSNHPFWAIDSQEWLEAGELTNRSILLDINDKNTTIKSLKHYAQNKKVYNLTVGNIHTYYVGLGGILGHNADCPIPDVRWIKHNLWNELKGISSDLQKKFKTALQKGLAETRKGKSGIIIFTENERNQYSGYTHKIKITGKGTQHYRILGKIIKKPNGTESMIFDKLVND